MIDWARTETPLVGVRETAAFVDYWRAQPGRDGEKTDWAGMWRNWMRTEQKTVERRRGFDGTPVQTALTPASATRAPSKPMCPRHRGEFLEHCRPCRSEELAAPAATS